jgi:hypothetical protein
MNVEVLARRSALGRRGRGFARVGRLTRARVPDGRTSFRVRVNSAARRALSRRGRLSLRVRVVVTPLTGRVFSATRRVTLRAGARG